MGQLGNFKLHKKLILKEAIEVITSTRDLSV